MNGEIVPEQTARSVEVGETRCEDCHEPTGTLAVCKVCAGLRVESVLGSGEGVAIRFIEDCSRASGGMVNGNQLAQRATEALKAMRALGSGEAEPVAWLISARCEGRRTTYATMPCDNGSYPSLAHGYELLSATPLYPAPPHPTPSAWREALRQLSFCTDEIERIESKMEARELVEKANGMRVWTWGTLTVKDIAPFAACVCGGG